MDKYLNILSAETKALLNLAVEKTLAKGDFFIRAGETCNKIAILKSGLMRSFYHAHDGREMTYCFLYPTQLIAAYSSFISQQPTNENIQAINEVNLSIISHTSLKKIEACNTNQFMQYLKFIAEQEYISLEERFFLQQTESAEVRLKHLITKRPTLFDDIPLTYIASYLGISARHLSQLLKPDQTNVLTDTVKGAIK